MKFSIKIRRFVRRIVWQSIVKSGLSPSRWLRYINCAFEFGKWVKKHECKLFLKSREDMYKYINAEIIKGAAIDYLEFGVYKGASMRSWIKLNREQNSRFFGFDSFEGLPEDWMSWKKHRPKGWLDAKGKMPEIDDQRVKFIKGYFQDSLPNFLKSFTVKNKLVIHLDADLYTSTLYVLASLNHIMIPGTILLFDEFSEVINEFRAFTDFSRSFMRDYKLLAAGHKYYLSVAIELE